MEKEKQNELDDLQPLKSIGLCFSGGGYRATFFSLGVLSYLHNTELEEDSLLNRVEALSSVSGGTLMAVAFAKATQSKDFEFNQFYKKFYETFTYANDRLLSNAVSKLKDDRVWKDNPHKKRSMINAIALAYEDLEIYKGTFSEFDEMSTKTALKAVCFNATEFSYGLTFRFQNTGVFSNRPLESSELNSIKGKIKFADIVASSSCFPLGFEPIVFPDDFIDHEDEEYKPLKELKKYKEGVGLMDGGIADNQGIGSMINMSKAEKRGRLLDLIIVNDVTSYHMEPWVQEKKHTDSGKTFPEILESIYIWYKLRPLYWIISLFALVMIVLNISGYMPLGLKTLINIAGGIILGFFLLAAILAQKISPSVIKYSAKVKSLFKQNVPHAIQDEVMQLTELDSKLIERMLLERGTSSVKMISEVFLKQIRRLNYNLLYEKSGYRYRHFTSTVYQLNGKPSAYKKNFKVPNYIKQPASLKLINVSLVASETGTTVWWGQEDVKVGRMDALIACGQFTTCLNLMIYIKSLPESLQTESLLKLYNKLEMDWERFNDDPYWLCKQKN